MPELVSGIDEERILASIRQAAEATLAVWPEAHAAVLFGSRARGDQTPESDWDIAFITRTGDRVDVIPKGLPIEALEYDIHVLAVPDSLARRKALSIGHIGHGISRNGKTLAGKWDPPKIEGKPVMEPDRYGRFINNVSLHLQQAASRSAEASTDWESADHDSDHFVANSANAAEHLAKAMLGRHGIDVDWTHDVSRLADQAEQAGHSGLASRIRQMNGLTGRDHVVTYNSSDAASLGHAIQRLPVVIQQLGDELAAAASDPGVSDAATNAARKTIARAEKAASILRQAIECNDDGPPPSYEWLAPLAGIRRTLLRGFERLAERMRLLEGGEGENSTAR